MRTVLFICSGNTCRSPMAEAIFRQSLAGDKPDSPRRDDLFIASAGIGALDGMPTAHETIEALRHMGIDYDGRSKRLTEQMIRKASLVVCMTAAHQTAARALVADSPNDQAKIVLLDPAGNDIEDPIGMGQREYDALARRLKAMIPARLKTLLDNASPGQSTDTSASSRSSSKTPPAPSDSLAKSPPASPPADAAGPKSRGRPK